MLGTSVFSDLKRTAQILTIITLPVLSAIHLYNNHNKPQFQRRITRWRYHSLLCSCQFHSRSHQYQLRYLEHRIPHATILVHSTNIHRPNNHLSPPPSVSSAPQASEVGKGWMGDVYLVVGWAFSSGFWSGARQLLQSRWLWHLQRSSISSFHPCWPY